MRYIHSTLPLSLHTLLTLAISFITRVKSAVPPGYTTPNFPSLYWPLPIGASRSFYLYEPGDIVRFTVYWTLILVGGIHLIVALWACIIQWRNWKLIWIAPALFVIIGGIEALVSGAIVGGL
jgi:cytochrome b561